MLFQNPKKTMQIFWTIIGIIFLSLVINMPSEIPVSIHSGKIDFEHTFYRPDFSFGNSTIKNRLDLKYGLDLAGGASLTFDIDTTKVKSENIKPALESLKTNIEKRVNLFGLAETNIQLSNENGKNRLLIELPGIESVDDAIQLIGRTAQLQFMGIKDVAPEATATATYDDVFKDLNLDGSHLTSATVQIDPNTSVPTVALEFNQEGTKLFAAGTKEFLNKRIAILLDGEVVTSPVVQTEIIDGKAVINGDFNNQTAKELAVQLNAGSLPLPISLIHQNQIGATLGQDSISKGIRAALIGLSLVAIFMIANYGLLGVISVVSLIIYALITLTLYRLIPVTLTFPGIVGFILSVGMAVDSNILIFARMQEELRAGKPWNIAMELAFGKAWDSIKDANTCTIITGLILLNPFNWPFLNTSGMIRGFAITLLLGIFISIFTGIFVTRNLLRVFARKKDNFEQ